MSDACGTTASGSRQFRQRQVLATPEAMAFWTRRSEQPAAEAIPEELLSSHVGWSELGTWRPLCPGRTCSLASQCNATESYALSWCKESK